MKGLNNTNIINSHIMRDAPLIKVSTKSLAFNLPAKPVMAAATDITSMAYEDPL